MSFGWGHLNVNVSDLERSIAFYGQLGFSEMIPGIPHHGLSRHEESALADGLCAAYGLPPGTRARGCILQLDDGFPKLDLTAFALPDAAPPPGAGALGCERLCLGVDDLPAAVERLTAAGVRFLTAPAVGARELAHVAVCVDPDGARIELIQIHFERFAELGLV
jgi:catechol 2,3-dioxygenase-like lactoylglutathione lyase family enzyme